MYNNKKNSFAANVVMLFIAQILVKIMGMVYRMVITNINGFGDSGMGYYSAGYQIYALLLAISSVGIPNAIAKLISEKKAIHDYSSVNKIFKIALIVFAIAGFILSCSLYIFSDFVAKNIIHMNGAELTMRSLSPSIFFVCVSSVLRGYFSGLDNMKAMSSSQILEQFVKSVLTISFVIIAIGSLPEVMAAWANFATTIATLTSLIYLFIIYKITRNNKKLIINKSSTYESNYSIVKIILSLAIPISFCSVITAINGIIDTATISRLIKTTFASSIPAHGLQDIILNPTATELNNEAIRLTGLIAKCDTLINLPLAMNIALATVLVPSISGLNASGKYKEARHNISFSMLMSAILILPCAFGYFVLAKPIYHLIYPNAPLGYGLLQLSTVTLIFTGMNQTITGALQGFGKVYVPVVALILGSIIKITLNILLISIPSINIYGAVISSIVCQFFVFIFESSYLNRIIRKNISFKKIYIKPIFCCIIMAFVAYSVYNIVNYITDTNMLSVAITIIVSAIIYVFLLFLTSTVSRNDLSMLPNKDNFLLIYDMINRTNK